MKSRDAMLGAVLVGVLSGCGGQRATSETADGVWPKVRDSAGVTIVENQGLDAKVQRWTLDSAPTLTIGGDDKGPEYLFDQMAGARFLPNGEVLLAEYTLGSSEGRSKNTLFKVFDSSGNFVRRFGGSGNGPGEFQQLTYFYVADDSIWVYDPNPRRGTAFDLHGRYGRTIINLPRVDWMVGRLDSGSWIALQLRRWKPFVGHRRDTLPLLRIDDNGKADTILTIPAEELDGTEHQVTPSPFTTRPRAWLRDSLIFAGTGETYQINVHSPDGALRKIIRRAMSPRAVTAEVIADFKKRQCEGSTNPDCRAAIEAHYGRLTFPKTMPTYDGFIADEAGNLWVKEYHHVEQPEHNTTWDVFDPNGVLLARATLAVPEGLTIAEIHSDRVAFLSRETAQVMVYRLVKVR